ncbi:MAG: hypothetical protein KGZ58_13965 [Ignavibacteriales bacterium]|nr:hypothetical protein [Ignavibacteriales bacterium]
MTLSISQIPELSIDEILSEAMKREKQMLDFYQTEMHEVGYDAQSTFIKFFVQQEHRIQELQELAENIRIIRELTGEISD